MGNELVMHKGNLGEGSISAEVGNVVDIWIKDWSDSEGNLATHTMHLKTARKWASQLVKAIDDYNAKKSRIKVRELTKP